MTSSPVTIQRTATSENRRGLANDAGNRRTLRLSGAVAQPQDRQSTYLASPQPSTEGGGHSSELDEKFFA